MGLSHVALDFLQTARLDRLLTRTLAEAPAAADGWPRARLAWLSSCTVEHLVPGLRIAALRRGLLLETLLPAYGEIERPILDDRAGLAEWRPQVVLFQLAPDAALPTVRLDVSAHDAGVVVARRVEELRTLWRRVAERDRATVIQATVPLVDEPLFGSFDALLPGGRLRLLDDLNRALVDAAVAEGAAVFDLDSWSARVGRSSFFDPVRWHHAKQLVPPSLGPAHGDWLARVVAAACGLGKKCLVVDLDDTLWGGAVGDDGVEGLTLGQGSAAGEAFAAFQRYLQGLRARGVVLAVCSKNDPQLAESAFARHPEMVLRREDVAAFVANWSDKASNLRAIANMLDIGLDSLVFVDDQPAERDLVRRELPMVAVPELPDDPALFARTLADAGWFDAIAFTADDRHRADQYRATVQRRAALATATDVDGFLESLAMRLRVRPFSPTDLPRVAQLVAKTNQFNLTTRRRPAPELAALAATPGTFIRVFRLEDRFGDNGLVSVVIATATDATTWYIDTWLMSCRVLGRGVERAALSVVADVARAQGASRLLGEYLPTAKNALVRDHYPSLGFALVDAMPEGRTRWSLDLATPTPLPGHIVVAREDARDG